MINLFCALPSEAKPLINQYSLKRYPATHLYNTYINNNHTISLTISGTGKQSASAAVVHAYMLLSGNKYDGWLNIGIAGHSVLPPATAVLANKIIDFATGKAWYPQIVFNTELLTETIITLDKPSSEYPEQGAIDMEASGFYETASKAGITELTQSLKFISDNGQQHYSGITKKSVSQLVDKNLGIINSVIVEISKLSEILNKSDPMQETYKNIISRWHFTHSQCIQLKKILKRWNVLLSNEQPCLDIKQNFTNSKEVLCYLSARLDHEPIHFG